MTSENRAQREARPPAGLWRHAMTLSLASVLAGCASPSPEPPPSPAAVVPNAREAALRELGFRPTEQGWELDLAGRVMFPVDDASLSAEAQVAIERLARTLRGLGITGLVIEGHTDNQGTAAYNQRLSERRAQVVALAFVERGFEPAQVRHQGFGFSRPIEDNRSEAGRQQNRRVTIIVSSL